MTIVKNIATNYYPGTGALSDAKFFFENLYHIEKIIIKEGLWPIAEISKTLLNETTYFIHAFWSVEKEKTNDEIIELVLKQGISSIVKAMQYSKENGLNTMWGWTFWYFGNYKNTFSKYSIEKILISFAKIAEHASKAKWPMFIKMQKEHMVELQYAWLNLRELIEKIGIDEIVELALSTKSELTMYYCEYGFVSIQQIAEKENGILNSGRQLIQIIGKFNDIEFEKLILRSIYKNYSRYLDPIEGLAELELNTELAHMIWEKTGKTKIAENIIFNNFKSLNKKKLSQKIFARVLDSHGGDKFSGDRILFLGGKFKGFIRYIVNAKVLNDWKLALEKGIPALEILIVYPEMNKKWVSNDDDKYPLYYNKPKGNFAVYTKLYGQNAEEFIKKNPKYKGEIWKQIVDIELSLKKLGIEKKQEAYVISGDYVVEMKNGNPLVRIVNFDPIIRIPNSV